MHAGETMHCTPCYKYHIYDDLTFENSTEIHHYHHQIFANQIMQFEIVDDISWNLQNF